MSTIEKIQYRGFEIEIDAHSTRFGTLYEPSNNYGEPVITRTAYQDKAVAIKQGKKDLDQLIDQEAAAQPRSTWCDCKEDQLPNSDFYQDGECPCGIHHHHYHCRECGGVTQTG